MRDLKKRANDFTENARSLGFRLVIGKFRFLDLGDLVWNELGQLVCPRNMLGEADVYWSRTTATLFAAVPAVVAAVHPRVAIMNNSETKGGESRRHSRRCTACPAWRTSGNCT